LVDEMAAKEIVRLGMSGMRGIVWGEQEAV
jgi:hypothetical protein